MNKEIIDMFKDTYKKCVDDNTEDFMKLFKVITKLCMYLLNKNILIEEDIKDILKIDED